MSYTIPTSVQTKAEAVLAVASAIADTDMGARYDGTVNTSLDVLADVLAAQDVDVPQTNAGAILALAQYAHGGGEGGGDFTTASVIFAKDTEANFTVACPNFFAGQLYSYIDYADIDGETPTDVALFNGSVSAIVVSETVKVGSVSGSAEINEDTGFTITGDCMVTFVDV